MFLPTAPVFRRGTAGTHVPDRRGDAVPPATDEPGGRDPPRREHDVDEKQLFSRINELVEEEHQLRASGEQTDQQRARMSELEAHLDQAWDLLRQRRARRQYGEDPDDASARPEPQVEGYLQ